MAAAEWCLTESGQRAASLPAAGSRPRLLAATSGKRRVYAVDAFSRSGHFQAFLYFQKDRTFNVPSVLAHAACDWNQAGGITHSGAPGGIGRAVGNHRLSHFGSIFRAAVLLRSSKVTPGPAAQFLLTSCFSERVPKGPLKCVDESVLR
jgi:hypothetical protein